MLGRERRPPALLLVALAVAALGCAPLQRVPLDVDPSGVQLYLDGAPVEGEPRELELRADRDHKLFFKRDGHRPVLVVLRSTVDRDGKPRLEPSAVQLRLIPIDTSGRQLVIESEESR